MHFISGVPDKLTVSTATDFIKSVEDDISKLTVLRDELKAYQDAKITIAEAVNAKAEADEYVVKTKAEIDSLKATATEKVARAKKREAEADTLATSLQAARDAIQVEKDNAEKEISRMYDTLKADIIKLNDDQADVAAKLQKYEQDRADLDTRIAKFQATAASLSQ